MIYIKVKEDYIGMIVKCKNCGGIMGWDPKTVSFKCNSCDSVGEMVIDAKEHEKITECPNCRTAINTDDLITYKCPSCGTPILEDIYLKDEHKPKCIVPFSLDNYDAIELFRERYKNDGLVVRGFLSKATPESLEGVYKPYYFVSGVDNASYQGQCQKIKKWSQGDTEYTKIDYYRVVRKAKIAYRNLPVYAGEKQLEINCESIEPYKTAEVNQITNAETAQLAKFNPKYLFGFIAERCKIAYDNIRQYTLNKVFNLSKATLSESIVGYTVVDPAGYSSDFRESRELEGLLPMWRYVYRLNRKNYTFYINGQTGKVSGNAPISKLQVLKLYAGNIGVMYLILFIFLLMTNLL